MPVPSLGRLDDDEKRQALTGRKGTPGAAGFGQHAAEEGPPEDASKRREATPGVDPVEGSAQRAALQAGGGDGTAAEGPTLQRLADVARERPEYDRKQANTLKWGSAAMHIAGSIAAAFDAPTVSQAFSRGSQTLSGQKRGMDARHANRLDAYYDGLLKRQQFNIEQANKEAEMGLEATLAKADRRLKRNSQKETQRHNKATEKNTAANNESLDRYRRGRLEGAGEDRAIDRAGQEIDRAQLAERRRHNKENERLRNQEDETARRTGVNLAIDELDQAVSSIDGRIESLRADYNGNGATVHADLIEELEGRKAKFQDRKARLLSEMEGADLKAYENGRQGGGGSSSSGGGSGSQDDDDYGLDGLF